MWQHWVNLLAAIWLIISAFINFSASGMTTNLIITGIIIGIMSLWGATQTSGSQMGTMTR